MNPALQQRLLAAFVNGLTLFAIVVWIVAEAVIRLLNPHQIEPTLMMWVAVIGLLVSRESLALPFTLVIVLLSTIGILMSGQMAIPSSAPTFHMVAIPGESSHASTLLGPG